MDSSDLAGMGALCATGKYDKDLWDTETKNEVRSDDERYRVNQARKVCARCPVKIECLEIALRKGERYGVWAATTPYERQRMIRRATG